jgi:hypothetical protein
LFLKNNGMTAANAEYSPMPITTYATGTSHMGTDISELFSSSAPKMSNSIH